MPILTPRRFFREIDSDWPADFRTSSRGNESRGETKENSVVADLADEQRCCRNLATYSEAGSMTNRQYLAPAGPDEVVERFGVKASDDLAKESGHDDHHQKE